MFFVVVVFAKDFPFTEAGTQRNFGQVVWPEVCFVFPVSMAQLA